MRYYKLIKSGALIGVVTSSDFRTHQKKHNILLVCDEQSAQFVQHNNLLYHAGWMLPTTTDSYYFETIEVIQIDKEEYDTLFEAEENGQDIVVDQEPSDPVEDTTQDPINTATIEYLREAKIKEMSRACNRAIEEGINVLLSDEQIHHFSLSTQDQLNLITLQSMILSGETMIPYHADGELCKYYTVDDISVVMDAAAAHKTFHVTYYNSLKVYINMLDDMLAISKIQYGVEIPDECQSDILKALYASMGGINNE